jgi:hypothetical protein
MPQDVAVYRHAGCPSLTSWWTFRATRAVPGRDVLVAAATLTILARESCKLIRDVSHHGRTSAGRSHRYSVSLQRLGQMGQERALVVLSLSCGHSGRVPRLCQYCLYGAVGPPSAFPGNRNILARSCRVATLT